MRPALLLVAIAAAAVIACGPPKMPSGPAPEYEDPPAPSWWKDGGTAAPAPGPAAPAPDAGLS